METLGEVPYSILEPRSSRPSLRLVLLRIVQEELANVKQPFDGS